MSHWIPYEFSSFLALSLSAFSAFYVASTSYATARRNGPRPARTLKLVPTLLLVRHGRTTANTGGLLAGRTPGVVLDEYGEKQADELAERLAELPLRKVVSSPLERTVATATPLSERGGTSRVPRPPVTLDDRLLECDYGSWTNRKISELTKEPMWKVVQGHPSGAIFPGGETLSGVQARALSAIREHDRQVAAAYGPNAIWVAVSHGDVIKSILADALAMHLDSFQRIVVDPCSVSVVRYTDLRPFVLSTNGNGAGLHSLVPSTRKRRKPSSDAVVGGGAG